MELAVDVDYKGKRDLVPFNGHDRAKLTDEHPASSYDIPVLVWHGNPFGIADLPLDTRIKVVWRKARTGPVWGLIQRAINAGYPIVIDPVG